MSMGEGYPPPPPLYGHRPRYRSNGGGYASHPQRHSSYIFYPPPPPQQPYSNHSPYNPHPPSPYYTPFSPDQCHSLPPVELASYQHPATTYYPMNNYMYTPNTQTVYYNQPPTQHYPTNVSSNPERTPQPTAPGQLPRIVFQGDIIIVNEINKVKPALDELFRDGTAMTHGIGFDMEWKPSFGKGAPRNPTSLIQLSTDKVCVIFWMMYLGHIMPVELFHVLSSHEILKIGQSLDSGDNERLLEEFHLCLVNSVDISILAKRKGFRKTNLKEQTKVLLGKNLSKYLCTSNWADIHLTPGQIRYAATDPYVTFLIYHKLIELPDQVVTPLPILPPDDGDTDSSTQDAEEISNSLSSLRITTDASEPQMELASKCPHCDRYFMKKVQLFAHLDHAHSELLPTGTQTCVLCSKIFRKYSALLIHQEMTGHTDNPTSPPSSLQASAT